MRGLWRSMVVGVVAAVGLTGCGAPEPTAAVPSAPPTTTAPVTTPAARTGVPELQVELVAGGLEHVWDIGFLPDGRALVTERRGRIVRLKHAAALGFERDLDRLANILLVVQNENRGSIGVRAHQALRGSVITNEGRPCSHS